MNLPAKGTFFSSSPKETMDIGAEIAKHIKKGDVIALEGVLGAGKTCLVKGIGDFLDINEEIISPTYIIVSEYEAKIEGESLPFYHIDAYRLNGDDDFASIGGEEYLYGGGIAVVEWSGRIAASLPPNTMTVEIEITGENSRIIHVSGKNIMENPEL